MRILFYISILFLTVSCSNQPKTETEQETTYTKQFLSSVDSSFDLNDKYEMVELEKLSSKKLKLLRNEIFARYGYIFESRDLTQHFSKQGWYSPINNNTLALSKLTATDSANIQLVKKREHYLEQLYKAITYQDYIDLVPQIKLPLEFNCRSWTIPNLEYDNDTIVKFKPEGAAIIGKLYVTDSEVAFIYGYPADIFYPIIKYYTIENIELGEIRLFKLSECIKNREYSVNTTGTITTDFTVNLETKTIKCMDKEGTKTCDTTMVSKTLYLR